MRALQYDAYGGIERLVLRDVPVPSLPGRGRAVLVRVVRAALNPKDALFRKGRFRLISGRRFPKWCGLDFAGEVTASNSPRVRVGERVFGALDEWRLGRGTLAEYVVTSEDELAPLPDGVGFEEGAAVALVGLTALQALREVLGRDEAIRVLVFRRTKRGVDKLARDLIRLGHDAGALHGDIPQRRRERVLEGFRRGTVSTLIATNLAARGIHVEGIDHVVNFDLPEDSETYVHRVGRTGRAGERGRALTFVTETEKSEFQELKRKARVPFRKERLAMYS